MSDSLSKLILSLTPDDGSTIGNGAMMALMRKQVSDLTDDDYAAACNALVDKGLLGRGKRRGGSIFRITGNDEDDADDTEDDFELTAPKAGSPRPHKAKPAGTGAAPRKSGEPVQVVSYRRGDSRVNNPEVGMVHADADPDGAKTIWAYDPHLDPLLNFDSARAGVEKLIDAALASGELQTLVSMSSIYGIDIADDNVAETRDGMWKWAFAIGRVWRPDRFGSRSFMSALWQVLDTNFIVGDFINDDGEITFTQWKFATDLSFVTQETRLKYMLPAPAPAPKTLKRRSPRKSAT